MGENVIESIKKLTLKTGNTHPKTLEEKAPRNALIQECNELYRTILIG